MSYLKRKLFWLNVFCLSFIPSFTPLYANQSDCVTQQKHIEQAWLDKDQTKLQALNTAVQDSSCSDTLKAYAARQLARSMYQQLAKEKPEGEALYQGLQEIEHVYYYFWKALIGLAEYHADNKNFEMAAHYYDRGLDSLDNAQWTPDILLPKPERIQNIHIAAENALAASDQDSNHVLNSRSGGSKGILSFKTRSVRVRFKRIPIGFHSNSARLKKSGLRYAKRLYRSLKREGEPNIRLVGHTDPKGNADTNRRLSEKRAETVKGFLEKQGYKGTISVTGEGEDKPLADPRASSSDPHTGSIKYYGKSRWYGMLRRVEITLQ